MEYPFKDLLPLDEVLAREGYYKDWTHLDPKVFYSLTQISNFIKTKGYGVDVRLLIAQLAEHFGLKTTQVVDLANLLSTKHDALKDQFDVIIRDATSGADWGGEVALARGGKATLGQRLDETTSNIGQFPLGGNPIQGLWEEVEQRGVNVRWFGAVGDGITDDSQSFLNALTYAAENNLKLVNEPNKTYLIKSLISIPMTEGKRLNWDMMGSTMDFTNGGGITIGSEVSYKSTILTSDLIKGKTKFDVVDASGVSKGDLVSIQSPVRWAIGIELLQFYTIGDIENNTIYVDGLIVGDLSSKQKTDAGVSGDIVVRFYKVSKGTTIKNGVLTSKNRDSSDILISLIAQDKYIIENIDVRQPRRMGVYTQYCGTGIIKDCFTNDSGYVEKDQGYSNTPSSPDGGLSFGYGFITARSYLTHYINCHSYSGWHGFDVARGQSVAIFQDCVIHKDAYGFSSHEGSWIFKVIGSHVLGGLGITTRSAELIVKDNYFDISLGRAISGNGSHQRLIIKNNEIDLRGATSDVNAFYLDSSFPSYCYSDEEPYSEFSGNTIIGVANNGRIRCRGSLIFSGNVIESLKNSPNYIDIRDNNGELNYVELSNNTFINIGGQQALWVTDTKKLNMVANKVSGEIKTFPISALLFLSGSNQNVIIKDNTSFGTTEYFARVMTGVSVFSLLQNNSGTGRIVFAALESSVKNAFFNSNINGLVNGGVLVGKEANNVIVAL